MGAPVKYGMIGCGMMGQEHIRNVALLDGAEIAAIYEPDAKMAAMAAALLPDVVFAHSVDDLLALEYLDALLITSPNHLHLPQLEEVARKRMMPVMVEKPLYTASDQHDRVKALIKSFTAPVWVGMEYRYMPPISRFLEQVQGATGGIKMLTIREHRFPFLPKVGNWNRFNRNTGGTLVEKCCHFFDLMRLAMGEDPVRVMASGGQSVNHLDEAYDGETPDIWDNGYVILDFPSGGRAMLELCMFAEGSRYQEEISATGHAGKIEVKVPGPGRFWPEHLGQAPVPKVIVSPRTPRGPYAVDIPVDANLLAAGDHNGATYYQHEKFLRSIQEGTTPAVSLADGAAAVRIGLAAQESATKGVAIEL